MRDSSSKAPWHLWVVGIFALLFNSIGVFDFVMGRIRGAQYLTDAGMTPAQVEHYMQMPSWMILIWAIGVFGAFAASIFLLMRRKLAFPVFVLSLVSFLLSLAYTYVYTNGGEIMGQQDAIVSAVIALLLIFFAWYSRFTAVRGVLR